MHMLKGFYIPKQTIWHTQACQTLNNCLRLDVYGHYVPYISSLFLWITLHSANFRLHRFIDNEAYLSPVAIFFLSCIRFHHYWLVVFLFGFLFRTRGPHFHWIMEIQSFQSLRVRQKQEETSCLPRANPTNQEIVNNQF